MTPRKSASSVTAAPNRALPPGLYVTATPIGNAADISARALSVLAGADAIIAEDTRVTGKLLAIHGVSNALIVYNDHNAPAMRPKILARLQGGQSLALVTDAGTPLVSDPGYKLVRAAREEDLPVFAVPGPSAALAALSIAGLPSDRFLFAGFLPAKAGERKTALEGLRDIAASLILFESAQRLAETLADMAFVFGPREAAVARELTKLHEEVRRGLLPELAAAYAHAPTPKGEVTLVIAPPEKTKTVSSAAADSLLRQALAHMPVSAAAALVAEATGENRRTLYARALELKNDA
jgi:16S rRNA (cytidine1402-2'-O)-methyltransferase